MAEETIEAQIKQLYAKMERESRFTRSAVIICTIAILGSIFYSVKVTATDIPDIIYAKFLEKIPTTYQSWKLLERTNGPITPGQTDTAQPSATP